MPAHADAPVALHAGYAFRPDVFARNDDRWHGAVGALTVDAPPVFHGFSGRLEVDVLAWPGQNVATAPMLAAILVPSLTYRFDDRGPSATASLGPAGGVVVADDVAAVFGVQAGLGVLVPLVDGFDVGVRVGIGGLTAVGLYSSAMVGLTVSPDVLIAHAMQGDGPEVLARKVAPELLPHEAHGNDNDAER